MKRSLFVLGAALMASPMACLSSSSTTPQPTDAGATDGAPTTDGPAGGDAGDGGVVIDCPRPSPGPDGGATVHGSGNVAGNETWTAADSPHVVPYDTSIDGTLTIEPCAEVLIAEGKSITVGSTGKLVAEGLVTKPIHIGARDPSKPFARISAGGGGTIRLAHATVDNGGDPQNTIADVAGLLFLQGVDQNAPTQPTLFVDTVTVRGSRSNGIHMLDGAGFAPGSKDLTVTGSAQFPVSMWARAVGTLPTGKYTGNATDEILFDGGGGSHAVHEDTTMYNRGVPYRVGNSLSGSNPVLSIERQAPSSPGLATLTVEAGVKVRLRKGGVISVQRFTNPSPAQGAIVVNGTAAQPVIFTSAEANPAPGDWYGIWFGLIPAPNNKIDHARVEYAGGGSPGGDACNTNPPPSGAIRIFGQPSSQFVTNTTIFQSPTYGIDRGWAGDNKIDFTPTNTFTNVVACVQTYPRDANGSCPSTIPCP